ncbi:hypothetical protein [Clostridium saccharoperbutylacetonicum]|uniref:hypothetical protein n=1 Tax=Clostridium saccharoperbutylacetonicum TaxID=36745 RepID=UPI000983A6AF|nr:hypothetical protein [Clostridium saccharoperbutylacetonicum]AQR95485.1 hypothetical protein CLSAP_28010 [Clostridium saccharoperbutylacetonicum]NSB31344.1 hypothetical protein [Clostridium saccharoperbutylacetonicum]
MEYIENTSLNKINISSFSEIISNNLNIDSDIIKNYIFANISLGIAKRNDIKEEIDKLYSDTLQRYHNIIINPASADNIIISQGTLQHEISARKVLGILLEAEYEVNLRNKLLKLLRKYYPIIYTTVKKHDKEKLKNKYMKMDILTRNIEAKFDAALYLYFAVYISPEKVDQGFVMSILNDIEEFEFGNLINQDVENELKKYKIQIQEIKTLIKNKYGKFFSYKDILSHRNEDIHNLGDFMDDLFISNKININHTFVESEFIDIDKIILSYIRGSKNKKEDLIMPSIVSGIFIQSLINEYKNTRQRYMKNNGEVKQCELDDIKAKLNYIEKENDTLKVEVTDLIKEKLVYEKSLNNELKKLNNLHKQEIKTMENRIATLENKLKEEKNLRLELESFQEYQYNSIDNSEKIHIDNELEEYINNRKIIIIGGDKEWRRRFRIKYPKIRTLNGFNENFDIATLNNSDYIFFYTKYMNHSTFYKAMNYIKFNKCKFGYIGKTNINLVEHEIIENINKCEYVKFE